MTHTFGIGDSVKVALDKDMMVHCANFGIVHEVRAYVPREGDIVVRLPDGRLIERHAKQLTPFAATARYTVGDAVTVSAFFDSDTEPHLRVPVQFWTDISPVRVMMIRHTEQGFMYLFEDVPVEYSRWISEIHLLSSEIGSGVDVLRALRNTIDPHLLAEIRSKLSLSGNRQEQALAHALD